MRKQACGLSLVIALSTCTVGPDYQRPMVDVPVDWRISEQEVRESADSRWWLQFNDPVLVTWLPRHGLRSFPASMVLCGLIFFPWCIVRLVQSWSPCLAHQG